MLHICCCACASVAIKRLKEEGFIVEGFFLNPNIHPLTEYEKRRKDLFALREFFSVNIIDGNYFPREWFNVCGHYSSEKEGGKRCALCYEYRLRETYNFGKEGNYDFFSTTLTISPHKSSHIIFEIGHSMGGDFFLKRDFKKKDGFKDSVEFSKEHRIYRQNYCGCVYSLLDRKQRTLDRRDA